MVKQGSRGPVAQSTPPRAKTFWWHCRERVGSHSWRRWTNQMGSHPEVTPMPHKLPGRSQSTYRACAPASGGWREMAPVEGFTQVLTRWQTSRVHTEQTLARMS